MDGAIVVGVDLDSPSAGADISVGDVVIKAGSSAVHEQGDLSVAVANAVQARRSAILLLVYRRDGKSFVGVSLKGAVP